MGLMPLGLAAFVSPGLFYVGAATVAVPILIHLFARRRYRRIRWAAIDFLVDAERRNRRRIRLEEWILLALRCSALLLIALLLARPFLEPTGLAAAFGGAARAERVFVIDDSYSMGYRSQDGISFDRAKEAVRRLLEVIRREAPDDTVTLLRMSAVDKPVETGTYLDDAQTAELLERLDALAPSQAAVDPRSVIRGVADQLARDPGLVNGAVYIISDFQRGDWIERDSKDGGADEGGIFAPLEQWEDGGHTLQLVLVNVGDQRAANTALTGLSFQTSQLVAGASAIVRTSMANHGRNPVENLRLDVSVGNIPRVSKPVRSISPGAGASLDVEVEFIAAGSEAVRVELTPDSLPIDNVRYAGVEVADAIHILIVNGEPSADSFDDETTFLATALRPEGDVFSGNELTIVDEVELQNVNLDRFHVVILANVYRPGEPAIAALERYVRGGGGVIIFLGDQVDADLYNTALYRDGEGLLPAELTEIISAQGGAHLVVTDRLHPAMRGVSREGDPLGLGRVPFFRYFGCIPAEYKPLDAGEDEEGADSHGSRPTRVVARFDDADEHPAIIQRSFGKGRVLLMATSADKEWNQWPDHPTFLPVMMEVIGHIARRSDSGAERWVGQTIEFEVDPAVYEPDVIVRTPAYPAEREFGVTAVAAADGSGLVLDWEHTDEAGVYQFVLRRRDGGESVKLVAVNVDPGESDLATVDANELRRGLGDIPFEYIQGVENLGGEVGGSRTELWRFFVFAAFVVLMGEQYLAWRWGRRR